MSKYQKIVLGWGIGIFLGFLFTEAFASGWIKTTVNTVWIVWLIITISLLALQLISFKFTDTKTILAQLTWIIGIIIGFIITYGLVYGHIKNPLQIGLLWCIIGLVCMVITNFTQRNRNYLIIAIIYLIGGILIYSKLFAIEYLLAGITFLVAEIADYYLDKNHHG